MIVLKAVKRRWVLIIGFLAAAVVLSSCVPQRGQKSPAASDEKIKAVVVTAGHGFDEEPFFAVFDGFDGIDYTKAHQQDDSELFEDISGWDYDVIVLYNMTQNISPKRRNNFLKLLDKGVGVVAMHHSIAAFQNWNEYPKMIGAKYYLKETVEDGVVHSASAYKHDLDISVHVEDARHPITRGMSDFVIHDEAYKNYFFDSGNRVLLSTKHPASQEPLCWVRRYGRARVCYIQLGHDHKAYENANFGALVERAMKWSAGRIK